MFESAIASSEFRRIITAASLCMLPDCSCRMM
jgi:hypothetical protein